MSLAALLPELAADIQGALVQLGRGDLADRVRQAPLAGWTRDAFAQATDLDIVPPDPRRPPGEIFSLHDECGVSLELDGDGRLVRIEVTGYEPILGRLEDLRARRAVFAGEGFRAVEMFDFDVPRLEAFFAANPLFHQTVSGAPATPEAVREACAALPPPEWPFSRRWLLLVIDERGEVIGAVDLLADLFAIGVWHVGLFVVATALHGSGTPGAIYAALEAWMKSRGARWLRLGVVDANARGERFWRRMGYVEVRQRPDYEAGGRKHLLHVMAKPLGQPDWERYRRLVPRDDPAAE